MGNGAAMVKDENGFERENAYFVTYPRSLHFIWHVRYCCTSTYLVML